MTKIIYNIGTGFSAKTLFLTSRSPIFFCQNMHLYQSLPHAQRELPKHVLGKVLVRLRSGSIGRIFCRIFGFLWISQDFV